MKAELLDLLRCPTTGQRLTLEAVVNDSKLIDMGWLVSKDGQHRYHIRNDILRFVPQTNYADNFGMQWNHFAKPNWTVIRVWQLAPICFSWPQVAYRQARKINGCWMWVVVRGLLPKWR